jgi:hypothetical protein
MHCESSRRWVFDASQAVPLGSSGFESWIALGHHKDKSWDRSLFDVLKNHFFNNFILVPIGNL